MKSVSTDDYEHKIGPLGVQYGLKISWDDHKAICAKLREIGGSGETFTDEVLKLLVERGYDPFDSTPAEYWKDLESFSKGVTWTEFSSKLSEVYKRTEKIKSRREKNELHRKVLTELLREKGLT